MRHSKQLSSWVSGDDHYPDVAGFDNGPQELVGARAPVGPGVNFERSTRAARTQRP